MPRIIYALLFAAILVGVEFSISQASVHAAQRCNQKTNDGHPCSPEDQYKWPPYTWKQCEPGSATDSCLEKPRVKCYTQTEYERPNCGGNVVRTSDGTCPDCE